VGYVAAIEKGVTWVATYMHNSQHDSALGSQILSFRAPQELALTTVA